jgi:hypothetical protein
MIQTVQLNTANLSAACQDYYGMKGDSIPAQLFIDSELYGVAITGHPIMSSHPYFEEIKAEALKAKDIDDKAMAKAAKDKKNIETIQSWDMDTRTKNDFMGVFVNATV